MISVPERYRLKSGSMATEESDGNNGVFLIPYGSDILQCIASDGLGWEHVSCCVRIKGSIKYSIPTWEQMCFVKDRFWPDSDAVIQYHPPRTSYVNNHPYVLHLWRPLHQTLPIPDSLLVGIKDAGVILK